MHGASKVHHWKSYNILDRIVMIYLGDLSLVVNRQAKEEKK